MESETNLADLALILGVLSVSCIFCQPSTTPTFPADAEPCMAVSDDEDEPERLACARLYVSAARHLLEYSEIAEKPTVQTLQASLLCALAFLNLGSVAAARSRLTKTLVSAQSIGLHIDPAKLAADLSMSEKEERRRLFWMLSYWDLSLSFMMGSPNLSVFVSALFRHVSQSTHLSIPLV